MADSPKKQRPEHTRRKFHEEQAKWKDINWARRDIDIARQVGVSRERVRQVRKQMGKPTMAEVMRREREAVQAAETAAEAAAVRARQLAGPTYKDGDEDYDDGDTSDDGLTHRQREFVVAMCGPAAGDTTKAARMAGYKNSPVIGVLATRTMWNPRVQAAIARTLARKHMTAEWAEDKLAERAAASMANFLDKGEDGEVRLNLSRAAEEGALSQLKEYEEEVVRTTKGGDKVIKRTVKVHDNLHAVELMLKVFGKLVDRKDITSGDKPLKGYVGISPDDWNATKPAEPNAGGEVPAEPDGSL